MGTNKVPLNAFSFLTAGCKSRFTFRLGRVLLLFAEAKTFCIAASLSNVI
jgi:hypothetical protein